MVTEVFHGTGDSVDTPGTSETSETGETPETDQRPGKIRLKIKVCGLKYHENIKAVVALKPEYAGFICYGASPRYIEGLDTTELGQLSPAIIKTGVFVNATADNINQFIDLYHFDAIQLHGNESPEFCGSFKGRVQVLKAFGMDEQFDFAVLESYKDQIDFFLFDTKTTKHGGSGKTFNWDLLSNYKLDTPFFLSGGLSLENLDDIKNIEHPQLYGVDLNSRFETELGLKDLNKLKQAFSLINN